MEKAGFVEFRNVGCSYFPQSRVDCHYTLSSQHNWASNDWIGLFKVLLTRWLPQKSNQYVFNCKITVWMFSSSGGMVISEGLPHICLGTGPARLSRGHRCQLLCALPGYSCPCFIIVFYFPYLAKIYSSTVLRWTHKTFSRRLIFL